MEQNVLRMVIIIHVHTLLRWDGGVLLRWVGGLFGGRGWGWGCQYAPLFSRYK